MPRVRVPLLEESSFVCGTGVVCLLKVERILSVDFLIGGPSAGLGDLVAVIGNVLKISYINSPKPRIGLVPNYIQEMPPVRLRLVPVKPLLVQCNFGFIIS